MFTGEFDLDLNEATNTGTEYPQYGRGFSTTNEPIEEWLPLTPIKQPDVLSVAASGDQPLLYSATGAATVDTFDISINACVMMDFKTTALQSMSYLQYKDTFIDINKHDIYKNKNIAPIIDQMPDRTRELTQHIANKRPRTFIQTIFGDVFPGNNLLYRQMQHNAPQPFNFIWADIMNVSKYLTRTYDIIYLSNIFDHCVWNGKNQFDMVQIIYNLWPHLRCGGYVLVTTPYKFDSTVYDLFHHDRYITRTLPEYASIKNIPLNTTKQWQPIVIQKTR